MRFDPDKTKADKKTMAVMMTMVCGWQKHQAPPVWRVINNKGVGR